MKQPMYKIVLSHPFAQLLTFLLIVIGGQIFAAPYGWIIRYAIITNEFFAIAGIVAIVLVLVSLFVARYVFQLLGLIAMWVSLIAFFMQTKPEARVYMFGTPLTVITLLLFVIVSLFIILKKKLWKN